MPTEKCIRLAGLALVCTLEVSACSSGTTATSSASPSVATRTSGASSSSDQSSFYGLNAAVLAKTGSITMNGGSLTTSGDGANGIFA